LNTIAKQYETEGITIDSRYFGYHNQTQNLNTIDVFNCSTSGTPLENAPNGICTLPPIEKLGGGDDFEKIPDGELVKKACGTLITKSIKDEKVVNYYVASRAVDRYGNYCSRLINSSGEPDGIGFLTLTFQIFISPKSFLRPIVVLNSNLQSNGNGTKENPWKVN
ncbi:MAG: hypothetical protein HFJ02_06945, partial [Bacilli bacterium]|nr:hypothetical protein [Bacilli bacterium]